VTESRVTEDHNDVDETTPGAPEDSVEAPEQDAGPEPGSAVTDEESGDEGGEDAGEGGAGEGGAGEGDGSSRLTRAQRLEQEGEIAADYLEELLEIADLDGDLDMDVEGDRATVSIVGADLPQLVGQNGEVLEALQELTRLAVYRETGERSRLMLDVSGHRSARRVALEEQAASVIEQVKESGEPVSLAPMSPFERKVVHDAVAAAGLNSESEGVEPRRHVVVLPA